MCATTDDDAVLKIQCAKLDLGQMHDLICKADTNCVRQNEIFGNLYVLLDAICGFKNKRHKYQQFVSCARIIAIETYLVLN